MALSKQPYKGTRDFFPKDKRQRDFIEEVMATTAESFGYEPYDTIVRRSRTLSSEIW